MNGSLRMTEYSLDELASAVKQLQSTVSSGTPEEVAETLITSYLRFGDFFFDQAKKQKALFGIHSIDRGNAISKTLHEKLVTVTKRGEMSEDVARRILRFTNEHRVIITPKIHIARHLNEDACWQIEREVALLGLAAEIEEQFRYQVEQARAAEAQTSLIVQSQVVYGRTKILLESGRLALREVLKRNPESATCQTEDCRWNEILMLADRWLAIQVVEDRYAYFNWKLFIDNSEDYDLVVCRPESFTFEGVLHFAEYRAAAFDLAAIQMARSKLELPESEVAARVLDHVSMGAEVNVEFFLEKMTPDIEKHVQILGTGLRQAVEEPHLAVLQGTQEYDTKVLPVLQAWNCLYRISILRQLALDRLSELRSLRHEDLVLVLPLRRLLQYFQEFGEMEAQQADSALRLLMFKPNEDSVRTYDPYLKPLISLNGDRVLVLETYIKNGRFARNTLKLLTECQMIDLTSVGPALERRFKKILKAAQFKTNEDGPVHIVDSDGKPLTDLDVVAYREGILFLGQAKAAIPPGSLYEIYRMLQTLGEAANQLRSCIENLDASREAIRRGLQLLPSDESFVVKTVLSSILTNDITLTGHQVKGFQVLDPVVLDNTLQELVSAHDLAHLPIDKLVSELESLSTMHDRHADRMTYTEVNLGDTIFLMPVVVLGPIKS